MPTFRELQEARERAERARRPFITKALDFLNRPHSAISGGITGILTTQDPVENAFKGLTGEQNFGGQDVISALFGTDNSNLSGGQKAAGLAFDFLNPIDPLNFVGIGGLTKAGKAARLGSRLGADELAQGFAKQVGEGQRGLVTFAGHKVPLPGDKIAAQGLEFAGRKVAESPVGRFAKEKLSGREGAIQGALRVAGQQGLDADLVNTARRQSEQSAALATAPLRDLNEQILKNTNAKERRELADLADAIAHGDDPISAGQRFIGDSDRRRKAFNDFQEFMTQRDIIGQETLQGTGISQFSEARIGYLSRVVRKKPGASQGEFDQIVGLTTAKPKFDGPSDNAFNKALVQESTFPVSLKTIDQEGLDEFIAKGGEKWFGGLKPKEQVDFLAKHRISLAEYDKRLRGLKVGAVERDVVAILNDAHRQLTRNIAQDDLILRLQDAGVAVPWSDAKHAAGKFHRIDQGRFIDDPLAIPSEYADIHQTMLDAIAPGAEKGIMGEVMSWWKLSAISGLVPSGYWTRNFATGLVKNSVEGLNFTRGNWNQTASLYGVTPGLARMFGSGNIAGPAINLPKSGVKVDPQWLWQTYSGYGVRGGGIPDVDVVETGISRSAQVRKNLVEATRFRKGSEFTEDLMRIPLYLKYLDDTFDLAKKRGMKVPEQLTPLSSAKVKRIKDVADTPPAELMSKQIQRMELFPEKLAGVHGQSSQVVEAAIENGKEAVVRAHFDYTDLSPTEQRLRANWIPFYTWFRKNIPAETRNMITNYGDYQGFVRGYYQAYEQQGLTREDLPEWAQDGFAVPISPSPEGRVRWMDFTGFLPFVEPLEAANAVLGDPRPGSSRPAEMLRFMGTRLNPFYVQAAEQTLRRNLFTDRQFSGEVPRDFLGTGTNKGPVAAALPEPAQNAAQRADLVNLLQLFRPAADLDRINPGNIFGAERQHRNEPGQLQRNVRALTGLTVREGDPNEFSLSEKEREGRIRSFRRKAKRARREGNDAEAAFFESQVQRLSGEGALSIFGL